MKDRIIVERLFFDEIIDGIVRQTIVKLSLIFRLF